MTDLSPMNVLRAAQRKLAGLHKLVASDDAHIIIYEIEKVLSDSTLALLSAAGDLPSKASRNAAGYCAHQGAVEESAHRCAEALREIHEVLRFLALAIDIEEAVQGADELVGQGANVSSPGEDGLRQRLLDSCNQHEQVVLEFVGKVGGSVDV